jgi:WhiB family redox-sensing transcriptional regulator
MNNEEYQLFEVKMNDSWREKALCRISKTQIDFFDEDKHSIKMAKSTCRRCIVADECLLFAVQNKEKFGIWGGFTPRERNKITRSIINLTKQEAKGLVIKHGNEVLSQSN